MQQEAVLAMLAKEPAHAYQLRARLDDALGPLGEGLNAGHVYVTLTRLERAGFVAVEEQVAGPARADRKLYSLTPAGQERVSQWLSELSWPKPDLAEFHLKLIAAAAAGLADPAGIVSAQRRELLRRLRDAQHAAMGEPTDSDASLLLEGIVLRLQADLRWLEACQRNWASRQDSRHAAALTRALGATARQLTISLAAVQLFPAIAGALAGIAGGYGLFTIANQGASVSQPPAWWLIIAVLSTLIAVAGLTAVPSRLAARLPIAETLQGDGT